MSDPTRNLAAAHGIAVEYCDIRGATHRVSKRTLRAILAAMHVDASDEDRCAAALQDLERERAGSPIPPLIVVRRDARPWRIDANLPAGTVALEWQIRGEDGSVHAGACCASAQSGATRGEAGPGITLDVDLPPGYHALTLLVAGSAIATATLAVAPAACYRPPALRGGVRRWGAAVQLYGLRSGRNWGIGDLSDLARFVELWGPEGADIVGLNPLHALRLAPLQPSPYSPSSRLFQNPLYIDVEAVPEFGECAEARAIVASAGFAADLACMRDAALIDYAGVAAAKLTVLAVLHAFARRCVGPRAAQRAAQFEAFKAEGGAALRQHALFETLQQHFHHADPSVWGWPAWPGEYRDPESPEVSGFAATHADEVDFHCWLQWQIALQRAHVAARARDCGVALGLYADLAVSIDRGGSEAWAAQDLYAATASVGAPPDAFNVNGQDWGLPPMIPRRLVDAGYAPFIATLRACMRDAGALRIDHVMGLFRLYWVPAGGTAAEGAYVHYPFADLLGLLALESNRHCCVVIGEDLGTVPDEVRDALAANDVLSYRVLLFERYAGGVFKPPAAYPEAALAVASTHDLPTLAGWWEGLDIAVRAEHGLLAADTSVAAATAERVRDRGQLLRALRSEGLLADDAPVDAERVPVLTADLAVAVQRFLARTRSTLVIVQAEDLLGVREQANLPGTVNEHPNWRRKLPIALDGPDAFGELLHALAAGVAAERRRSSA